MQNKNKGAAANHAQGCAAAPACDILIYARVLNFFMPSAKIFCKPASGS